MSFLSSRNSTILRVRAVALQLPSCSFIIIYFLPRRYHIKSTKMPAGRRALVLLLGDSITQLSFPAQNAGWGAHLADICELLHLTDWWSQLRICNEMNKIWYYFIDWSHMSSGSLLSCSKTDQRRADVLNRGDHSSKLLINIFMSHRLDGISSSLFCMKNVLLKSYK